MKQDADRQALAEKVALACRILGAEGLSRAALGHVSVRLSDDLLLIKARGPNEEGLEFTTARDIIELRLDGSMVEPRAGLIAPNESCIHLEIYKVRPDVRCVIHVHPPYVVAMAAAGRELLPLYGAFSPSGLVLAAGALRYYPKSLLISTAELGSEVALALGDGSACVLKGHGIVTVGATVEAAVLTALALGELAHINWLAASVGEPQPLDAGEIAQWKAFLNRHPGGVTAGRTDSGEPPEFYYYARRDAARHHREVTD